MNEQNGQNGVQNGEQGAEEEQLMILGMMMEPNTQWELIIQAERSRVEGAINQYAGTGEIKIMNGRTTTIHKPYAVAMFATLGIVSHEELVKQQAAQAVAPEAKAEIIPSEEDGCE